MSKSLGSFVTTQSWERIPILGSYLKSKGKIWGACHLHLWRQNLENEFQRQMFGPSLPLRHPNIEVSPGFKTDALLSGNQVEPKRADVFCFIHTVMVKPGEWGFSS